MNKIEREDFWKAEPIGRDRHGLIIATNDEGLIALKPEFVELFRRLTVLPEYYLQTRRTRHLSTQGQIELRCIGSTNLISDCEKSLQLDRTKNHSIYAHVSRCKCCGPLVELKSEISTIWRSCRFVALLGQKL